MSTSRRRPGATGWWLLGAGVAATAAASCAAPSSAPAQAEEATWQEVLAAADGSTVQLWMYGGDRNGNRYVDEILTPAAERLGVSIERVPVADTADAVNRVLAERQAGRDDGSVDLVWVNGENFAAGMQAGGWLCGWASDLPNADLTDPQDPLLTNDFGTPVADCESPWHKAQFALAYDSARVDDPPRSMPELLSWIQEHPGRFTYPAPPDFTGSAFVRQVLYAVAGGHEQVPDEYDPQAYAELAPKLWKTLEELEPSLWRGGSTYPRSAVALDRLYATGEVDMTMTYGPATLTALVADGSLPASTQVLRLDEGTLGNASFLAIPSTSPDQAAAMVVANLALSPQQQAAKADPDVWGQFTVLDLDRLGSEDRRLFADLPDSPVVPPYEVLSDGADPELGPGWVKALDDGWRREVAAGD